LREGTGLLHFFNIITEKEVPIEKTTGNFNKIDKKQDKLIVKNRIEGFLH